MTKQGQIGKISPIIILVITLSIPCEKLKAQTNEISGVVLDYESREPLPGVNVFLDKTNRGTATDQNGRFHLDNMPDGLYTIVVSMIGYQNATYQLTFPRDENKPFEFLLKSTAIKLGEIKVVEDRPRKWLRNLDKFKEHFLGYTRNSDKTKILNPEVLEFDDSKGAFTANVHKPLKIRNDALGYDITFFLDRFVVRNQTLQTNGYSLYNELKPDDDEQLQEWIRERKRAYNGSYRHFIQSLYKGNYRAEGFRIHLTDRLRTFNRGSSRGRYVKYNEQKVEHKDQILTPAEIGKIAITTKDPRLPHLRVKYIAEEVEQELAQRQNIDRRYYQLSWIELPNDKAVVDIQSGGEIAPHRAILHGYWGFSSRIPDLLPANYNPESHTGFE